MRRLCLVSRGSLVALGLALCATAVRGGDDALRKQILELNQFTGSDPMRGMLHDLREQPEHAKKLIQTGVVLLKEKKLQYNAAMILAQAAADLKDFKSSEAFFRACAEQAVKLNSTKKLLESYGGLIDLLYDSKKYAESARVCRELLELKFDDGKPREYYVAITSQFGDVDFVPVESFDAASPLHGGVHRLLVQAMAKQGKFDQALKLVDDLVRQKDHWMERQLKGWVLNEAGKFEAAAAAYEDVLDRIAKDKRLKAEEREFYSTRYRYLLSHIYVDLKQLDKATEQLQELLNKKPDDPGLNNDLGYIWADHDMRLDEAEKLIRKALELDKKRRAGDPDLEKQENGAYLDSLGWVLFKQKKFKEAKEVLLKALEDKSAQHIEIYDHLGDVNIALGDREAALTAWRKGLEVVGEGRREAERKTMVERKIEKHSK
jgi:tetratricopeptide (TPR) repeat protein